MPDERILLVDDEEGILTMLQSLLRKEGYSCLETARTGDQALKQVRAGKFDLIILDVMLPDADGFDLCREIRAHTAVPIFFVTALSSDLDKLTGLRIGGDDYITKPFQPLELVARVKAQLRRQALNQGVAVSVPEIFHYGSFYLDKSAGELSIYGKPVYCTAKEFELLVFFCEHPNRIYTAIQLYEQVWNGYLHGDEKTVVIHISRLRKKIEVDPSNPQIFVNIRGIGYKFVPPEDGGQA